MVTTSSNYLESVTKEVQTSINKPAPAAKIRKCTRCDESILNEEACPRCNALTEDAKPLLLD